MPSLEREQPERQQPDILARLEQAVAAIHDSATFRRYLETQARFHRYSFANTLLILLQRPDATQVAGFQAWKKLGRQVRRGEKGIAIVVPHTRKMSDEGGEDGEERRVAGFGTGHVFDISQTDGEPLPAVAVPVLAGEEGQALYDRLTGLVARENLSLERQSAEVMQDGVMGFHLPAAGRIVVREAAPLQMTKTLAHELGHHFSGQHDTRAESETIAESVAFVVCAHHGLDTGERSFPYVATWSQDTAAFKQALGTIQRVSARMIDGLEQLPTPANAPAVPSSAPQPLPLDGNQLRLL
jgi:antirestriction protein ArdC